MHSVFHGMLCREWTPGQRDAQSSYDARRSAVHQLTENEIVGNPDIGSEAVHHRAVLLDRKVDGAPSLRFIQTDSPNVINQVDRDVTTRLLLATGARQLDVKRLQLDSHLFQDRYDIGRGAGAGGQKQERHGARRGSIGAVNVNRWRTADYAIEFHIPLPGQCPEFGFLSHDPRRLRTTGSP